MTWRYKPARPGGYFPPAVRVRCSSAREASPDVREGPVQGLRLCPKGPGDAFFKISGRCRRIQPSHT